MYVRDNNAVKPTGEYVPPLAHTACSPRATVRGVGNRPQMELRMTSNTAFSSFMLQIGKFARDLAASLSLSLRRT
jgi:hypothetical protein